MRDETNSPLHRNMTKKQIWKFIADAFRTPPKERTELQTEVTGDGICCAIVTIRSLVQGWHRTTKNTFTMGRAVLRDVEAYAVVTNSRGRTRRHKSRFNYFCKVGTRHSDKLRADYCDLQAEMGR